MRLDVFGAKLFVMQTADNSYNLFTEECFGTRNQLLHSRMSTTCDHHRVLARQR